MSSCNSVVRFDLPLGVVVMISTVFCYLPSKLISTPDNSLKF
jgi:hypothetical protein